MNKICTICKKDQDISFYHNSKNMKDKHCSYCKECDKIRKQKLNTPEYLRARYLKNREKNIAACRSSYLKHKAKRQITQKKRYEATKHILKDKWKSKKILNEFGNPFGLEDYLIAMKKTNGVCEMCGTDGSTHKKRLCMDHDHSTGIFRGVLCGFCNSILGYAKDNPTILQKGVEYLNKSKIMKMTLK